MPWVRFTENFDWKPTPQNTTGYLKGQELLVTTPCANAAKARGVAEDIPTPRKDDGKHSPNTRPRKASKEAKPNAASGEGSDTAST